MFPILGPGRPGAPLLHSPTCPSNKGTSSFVPPRRTHLLSFHGGPSADMPLLLEHVNTLAGRGNGVAAAPHLQCAKRESPSARRRGAEQSRAELGRPAKGQYKRHRQAMPGRTITCSFGGVPRRASRAGASDARPLFSPSLSPGDDAATRPASCVRAARLESPIRFRPEYECDRLSASRPHGPSVGECGQ